MKEELQGSSDASRIKRAAVNLAQGASSARVLGIPSTPDVAHGEESHPCYFLARTTIFSTRTSDTPTFSGPASVSRST
ncbi:hypothetical protein PUN4_490108 [Paraburkholderia unamae]|nr:hypothetical protein PUN4_490108 [Paraburkholderia unamae]